MAEARAALERWLERYGRAWERHDAGAFADLFTEDALYQERPFDEPMQGRQAVRAYAETAALHQRGPSPMRSSASPMGKRWPCGEPRTRRRRTASRRG